MNGRRRWQKFTLGVLYLAASTWLADRGIRAGADMTGMALVFAGMATGVGAVVWGNVQEHRAEAKP